DALDALGRFAPVEIGIGLVIDKAGNQRPAIIAARLDDVDLIVARWAVLSFIEDAIGAEGDALRIAVAIGIDVALDAIDLGIVLRDRAVELEPKDLARIGLPVFRFHFVGRRQVLGAIGQAIVAAEIGALFADRIIELVVRAEDDAAGVMVIAAGQAGDQHFGRAELAGGGVIGVAHDLRRGLRRGL